MAVAPLFVANIATLKAKLRLSKAANDALSQIDYAIEQVRIQMFDSLGESRITALLAISYAENPTTASGIVRLKANNAEVAWVRLYLLRIMPTLFMDSSAETGQRWNDEGLTRNMSAREITNEIARLETEIFDMMEDLSGAADPSLGNISVSSIGPEETPPRPGDSIFPSSYTLQ